MNTFFNDIMNSFKSTPIHRLFTGNSIAKSSDNPLAKIKIKIKKPTNPIYRGYDELENYNLGYSLNTFSTSKKPILKVRVKEQAKPGLTTELADLWENFSDYIKYIENPGYDFLLSDGTPVYIGSNYIQVGTKVFFESDLIKLNDKQETSVPKLKIRIKLNK